MISMSLLTVVISGPVLMSPILLGPLTGAHRTSVSGFDNPSGSKLNFQIVASRQGSLSALGVLEPWGQELQPTVEDAIFRRFFSPFLPSGEICTCGTVCMCRRLDLGGAPQPKLSSMPRFSSPMGISMA
ncbi:hypothetical protein B0H66DRAFT_266455 [Apodospora peruviana]|uniref:Secreted protein n=1 Tax=Apodospora peruviana TaxID=516989 RepID=A0AAE0M4U4_9PEZI|nr:hypothetical protein B0H66DRAFT_266455 [Apodospora peruviana]